MAAEENFPGGTASMADLTTIFLRSSQAVMIAISAERYLTKVKSLGERRMPVGPASVSLTRIYE
jgi:hypothetical protein